MMYRAVPYRGMDDGGTLAYSVDGIEDINRALNNIHKAPVADGVNFDEIEHFHNWEKWVVVGRFGIGLSNVHGSRAVLVYSESRQDVEDVLLLSVTLIRACDNYFDLFRNAAIILSNS